MNLTITVLLAAASQSVQALSENSSLTFGLAASLGAVIVTAVAFGINGRRDITALRDSSNAQIVQLQTTLKEAKEANTKEREAFVEERKKDREKLDALESERMEIGKLLGDMGARLTHAERDILRLQQEKADNARFESFERLLNDVSVGLRDVREHVHKISGHVTALNAREALRSELEERDRKG